MTEAVKRHPYLPEKTILIFKEEGGQREVFVSPDIEEGVVKKIETLVDDINTTQRLLTIFTKLAEIADEDGGLPTASTPSQ